MMTERKTGAPGAEIQYLVGPSTPMILVSWNSASDMMQKALNTGTDQIQVWPFTTEQLGARVQALINARKPFVETESYLGPDRRDPQRLVGANQSFEVPNALRARDEGRPDLAPATMPLNWPGQAWNGSKLPTSPGGSV